MMSWTQFRVAFSRPPFSTCGGTWESLKPRTNSLELLQKFYDLDLKIRDFYLNFPRVRRDPKERVHDSINNSNQPPVEPSQSANMSTGSAKTSSSRYNLDLSKLIANKMGKAPAEKAPVEKDTVRTTRARAAAVPLGGNASVKVSGGEKPPTNKKRKAGSMVELPDDVNPFKENAIVLADRLDCLLLSSSDEYFQEHFSGDDVPAMTDEGLAASFQAFQYYLGLRKRAASLKNSLNRTTQENMRLMEENEKLKSAAKQFSTEKAKWDTNRLKLEAANLELEDRVKSLQAKLDEEAGDLAEMASFYGWKGRIEAMQAIKEDPKVLEQLDEEMMRFKEAFPGRVAENTEDDACSTLSKKDAPVDTPVKSAAALEQDGDGQKMDGEPKENMEQEDNAEA